MSAFTGSQGKGAMKTYKESKRKAAEARQTSFEEDVQRIMHDQNVERPTACRVAAESRRFDRRKTQKLHEDIFEES